MHGAHKECIVQTKAWTNQLDFVHLVTTVPKKRIFPNIKNVPVSWLNHESILWLRLYWINDNRLLLIGHIIIPYKFPYNILTLPFYSKICGTWKMNKCGRYKVLMRHLMRFILHTFFAFEKVCSLITQITYEPQWIIT